MQQSLIIITAFLISFAFGDTIYKYNLLSLDKTSRLILSITIILVFLVFWSRFSNKLTPHYPFRPQYLKYKLYSFTVVVLCSIVWSYIATLLDAGFIDYTIDMLVLAPVLFIGLAIYTLCIDRIYADPTDEYYVFGKALSEGNWNAIWQQKNFLRMIVLKSQFLPFMYMITLGGIERLLYFTQEYKSQDVFNACFVFGIMFDVLIGFFGYFFTSRILDNKILHIEDNIWGWIFCLACYPPFYYFLHHLFPVIDQASTSSWLTHSSIIGKSILVIQAATWVVYWWSTLEFGFKFSNLTWRGLVDTGPYRYFKHPAYLSKNLYWWLGLLPSLFFVDNLERLKIILGMSAVSLVYYARAKCEERHLSRFAEYKNYQARFN